MTDIRELELLPEEAERVYAQMPALENGYFDYCPTCKKTGSYRRGGKVYQCDCEMQLALAKHYTAAGIPQDYQRIGWADIKMEPPEQVQDYLAHLDAYLERGVGLVFSGPRGAGKTMLAVLVLKEIVKRCYPCYYTTFATTVEAYTNGWGGNHIAASWFRHKFLDSKALLLDDMGKEFFSKIQLNVTTFDHILRTREQNNRPTLLTTNMTIPEMTAGYGEGILSMLVGKSFFISMSAPGDFRYQLMERITSDVHNGEERPIV